MSESVIPLAEPFLGGNELAYLERCIDTNFVSSVGPFVDRFEREFASFVKSPHAIACASGTAALHVALQVAGVGPGDEVFVPTFTFIASANAITYLGAKPTFVDSEAETWNLDPDLVAREISNRIHAGSRLPRAIEVVHILGHPARLEPIAELCERHGIALIEDAAEALGARYVGGPLHGRQVGTIGQVGAFSFNGNKVVTTGGGGMIVTGEPDLAKRAKHLTTQARLPGLAYDHDEVGYNYRLSNLAAAVGTAQLEQLPDFLAAKGRIAARYDESLRDVPGLELPPRVDWADRSSWLYSVRLASPVLAAALLDGLGRANIGARPVWPPVHRMRPYTDAPIIGDGSVADSIASATVSLPSSVKLTEADQDRVIEATRTALLQLAP
jgi:dTDP-4-amino-4,6-dideoxygalactose transaminase